MDILEFSLTFHQPFLIAAGFSDDGLDANAAHHNPVPATSLKGAMRAASTHTLGVRLDVIERVFGARGMVGRPSTASGWAWSDAGPLVSFTFWSRSRNRLDSASGSVIEEALTTTEEVWQRPQKDVTFSIEREAVLDPHELAVQSAVLQCSAYAVTALGQWRNRGMGTVTMRPITILANLPNLIEEVTQ